MVSRNRIVGEGVVVRVEKRVMRRRVGVRLALVREEGVSMRKRWRGGGFCS